MTRAGLRAFITDLIGLLPEATPAPVTTTVVTLASLLAILWGVIKLLRKVANLNLVDAYTRLQHVRGRNEAQNAVAAALAERGTPADLIRGLEVLRQVSPMDAPGSGLFVGNQPNVSIPAPRKSTPRRAHRSFLIVHPGPLPGRTPSGGGTT